MIPLIIFPIPEKNTELFVCTYDVQDSTGEYKTKVLNEKNEEIFKDKELLIKNAPESEDNMFRIPKVIQ